MDKSTFKLPILATVASLGTWYWLLLYRQAGTKHKLKAEYEQKGKVFDRYFGKDGRMLSVDRIVGNTQEQLIPMLTSLWLHAIFVDPDVAGKLGLLWTALRIGYSYLMPSNLEKIQPKRVFFATGPQYLIIGYLLGSTAYHTLRA